MQRKKIEGLPMCTPPSRRCRAMLTVFSCIEREGMMLGLFSSCAVLPFHLQVC